MDLTREEMETIITYNEAEQTASVFTYNTALRNKLSRLAEEYPDECKLEKTAWDGKVVDYTVPKRWVKVSPPRKVNMTDEQKQALAERLQNAREQNK